ncbi:MAG TPA: hypothetical protein VLG69_01695 [Candidatus Andersenbacteria bacterium]|nr:hypothetical protein [Candidatus Andersenbacteria bacterium]
MKFAVIEYSSKTRKIWHHTESRPNYICDPIKEIDPTSFGCYVSALKGEHIPLTYLIIGDEVNPITRIYRKISKRISGSWPLSYSIEYLSTFDALLVVYQISDGHEMVAFLKKLRSTYPNIIIIGVPTQPYGILKDLWNANPEKRTEIKSFIDQCDVFLTIAVSTLEKWQELTERPVLYLPQPYPVEYALQEWKSRNAKSNIIFVAGITGRENIIKGQIVAKKLQEKFPQYRIQMAQVPDMEIDTRELTGATFDIVPFLPWREHLKMLAKVALVINTDYTFTRGRVQVDCAAVGTPSIGANSDGQDDLFPKLPASEHTSIQQLVLQGEQLLNDVSYYDEVMRTGKERLKKYNYEESRKRLEEVIVRFKHA